MKQKNVCKIIDGEVWYNESTYARMYGRDRQDVFKAVKNGSLRSIRHRGKVYVTGSPLAGWVKVMDVEPPKPRKSKAPTISKTATVQSDILAATPTPKSRRHRRPPDLNAEKARKMAADAKLSELKLEKQRGDLASSYCNMIFDCFVRAFSPFKLRLIELKLTKEQTKQLEKLVDTALADMRLFIDKELESNGEDETQDEEDEAEE